VLRARGFEAIEDPEWKEKAYAEMPEASRRNENALVSENHRTIALRANGEWHFFQLGGRDGGKAAGAPVKRELWESLGIGWEAVSMFESLELPVTRTEKSERAVPLEWRDPRMLEY
jgi:hypothetical protein